MTLPNAAEAELTQREEDAHHVRVRSAEDARGLEEQRTELDDGKQEEERGTHHRVSRSPRTEPTGFGSGSVFPDFTVTYLWIRAGR